MLRITWAEMKELLTRITFSAVKIETSLGYLIIGNESGAVLYTRINKDKEITKDQADFEANYRDKYKWA